MDEVSGENAGLVRAEATSDVENAPLDEIRETAGATASGAAEATATGAAEATAAEAALILIYPEVQSWGRP